MLQVYHDGMDVAFESQTADHGDEDDDDTSSDILQPTQVVTQLKRCRPVLLKLSCVADRQPRAPRL